MTLDYESPPPLTMPLVGAELRVGVVCTRGNVRPRNEDNFYVPGMPSLDHGSVWGGDVDSAESNAALEQPVVPGLFLVADGMGGQLAGEKASQMAVEIIPRHIRSALARAETESDLLQAIREAVNAANQEVIAQSHLQPEFSNMGTTLGLALFRDGKAYTLGIGDSRIYQLRAHKLSQLTRDHSLANALGEAGTIRPEEVETHKFKNILYLYLGSREVGSGQEEIKVHDYKPGDLYLLATDGLTGVVRDEVLVEVLSSQDDPQRAAQQLINRAIDNHSKDNITGIVIRVV